MANEILWGFENSQYRNAAVIKNRAFIEQNVDYAINMKIIANKYHELISTIKS